MRVLTTDSRAESVPAGAPGQPRPGHLFTAVGAVGVALLASLCCIGPVLFVTFGVGASLATRFEPLRPLFTVLTLALLALGFYAVYGRKSAVVTDAPAQGVSCTIPRDRTRDKLVLWIATVLALVVLTFPQWSLLFV